MKNGSGEERKVSGSSLCQGPEAGRNMQGGLARLEEGYGACGML